MGAPMGLRGISQWRSPTRTRPAGPGNELKPAAGPDGRISHEAVGEGGDVVEPLPELRQRGGAVAVRLLRHVDVAEAQATGVAVDDVSHEQIAGLGVEAALD